MKVESQSVPNLTLTSCLVADTSSSPSSSPSDEGPRIVSRNRAKFPPKNHLAKRSNISTYCRVGQGNSLDLAGLKVCGRVIGAIRCPSHEHEHDLRLLHSHCDRLQCPTCYEDAVKRSARRITDRMEKVHKQYSSHGVPLGKPKHMTFSPPQDEWTRQRVESDGGRLLKEEVARLMQRFFKDRAYGGYLIFHGERRKHVDGSECDVKHCTKRHVWTWGPHFHYIGYGYFENSSYVHSKTGWVVKRIEDRGERDIYSTVHYQLTHAGLFLDPETGEQRGTAYWSYGLFANCNAGSVKSPVQYEAIKCSKCQQDLHEYYVVDQLPDWTADLGPYRKVVQERTYYLTKPALRRCASLVR